MEWIDKTVVMPEPDERVLVYSPIYEEIREGHEMIYRIMAGQLVRICTDGTHWMRLNPPTH